MAAGDGGEKKIIVVKKKVASHGAHHGGSWKVAYADFVTAMMAFFLVMWIMGMDSDVKDLVQGYFSNPVGFQKSFSGGSNPISRGNAPTNLGLRRAVLMSRQRQQARFESAARRIEETLGEKLEGSLGLSLDAIVDIVVTEEGLRIELMEPSREGVFFRRSSAEPEPLLGRILEVVGPELALLPNLVVLEGHTDAIPFRRDAETYGNWELSVDRANAARRILSASGMDPDRLVEVRGYADRRLRVVDDPSHPSNRRISILIPFVQEGDVQRLLPDDPGVGSGVPRALPAVQLPPASSTELPAPPAAGISGAGAGVDVTQGG